MPTFPLQHKHAELDRHNAALLITIAKETDDTPIRTVTRATPAGDERRLRGIPVIAQGVPGHIPGTNP